MRHAVLLVLCLLAMVRPVLAEGVQREEVLFEVTQTTVPGQSVFVLGNLPELGGGDVRRAVKLEPSAYPVWRVRVAIPVNRSFSYQYYIRQDGPTQIGNPANGTPVGVVMQGQTSTVEAGPKTVIVDATFPDAVLHWRQPAGSAGGSYTQTVLYDIGPGSSGSERRWSVQEGVGVSGETIEFYVTSASGPGRIPSAGTHSTDLDALLVRQTGVFSYVPAGTVSPQRQENVFSFPSAILGENRPYRVLLPRGYDEHTDQHYPVLYMHDGQNVFDVGPFGSWNADETAEQMMRLGKMREIIIVGIDNTGGSARFRDYIPAGDSTGQGANYAAFIKQELKPVIDANYRTLTGSETTGSMGSSLGGVCAMYHGWDHHDTFERIGSFSGSWAFVPNFVSRLNSEANPDVRVYLDSGDSGTSNDGYWGTFSLRDALVRKQEALHPYAIEGGLRYVVGFGQQHNEAAWAGRLPFAFESLYPASESPNGLAGVVLARRGDVNGNGVEDVEDLYAFESGEGPYLDVIRDGVSTVDQNRAELRLILRAGETAGMLDTR